MRCPQAIYRSERRSAERVRSRRRQAGVVCLIAAVMGLVSMSLIVTGHVGSVAFVIVQWVSGFTASAAFFSLLGLLDAFVKEDGGAS